MNLDHQGQLPGTIKDNRAAFVGHVLQATIKNASRSSIKYRVTWERDHCFVIFPSFGFKSGGGMIILYGKIFCKFIELGDDRYIIKLLRFQLIIDLYLI